MIVKFLDSKNDFNLVPNIRKTYGLELNKDNEEKFQKLFNI